VFISTLVSMAQPPGYIGPYQLDPPICVTSLVNLIDPNVGVIDCVPDDQMSGAPSLYDIDSEDLYLIWRDEFNDAQINYSSKWIPRDGVEGAFEWGEDEYNIYSSANTLTIANETGSFDYASLMVQALNQIISFPDQAEHGPGAGALYTAFVHLTQPVLHSKHKFLYGRYEIRCKVPDVFGLNPSFWLFGETTPNANLFVSNEIDLFEFLTDDSGPQGDGRLNDNQIDIGIIVKQLLGPEQYVTWDSDVTFPQTTMIDGNSGPYIDCSSDFHVYTLDWFPDRLYFMVDGVQVAYCNKYFEWDPNIPLWGDPEHYRRELFPTRPVNIKATVHKDRTCECTDAQLPDQMVVDYIRYYGFKSCGWNVTVDEPSDILNADPDFYNYIAGQNIIINTTAIVNAGVELHVFADQTIDIQPGFEVLPGSNAEFIIDATMCSSNMPIIDIDSHLDHNSNNKTSEISNVPTQLVLNVEGELLGDIPILKESQTWKLIDVTGKEVFFGRGYNELERSFGSLTKGIYFVMYLSESEINYSVVRLFVE
jgi:hypothetical protein